MNLTTIEKIQFNQVKEQIERHCVSSLGKKRFKNYSLMLNQWLLQLDTTKLKKRGRY